MAADHTTTELSRSRAQPKANGDRDEWTFEGVEVTDSAARRKSKDKQNEEEAENALGREQSGAGRKNKRAEGQDTMIVS